jgi:aminoglycoside phosphotransferase (APT) family kinase protein
VIPVWLETLQRLIPDETARHALQVIAVSRAHVELRGLKFFVFADGESEPRWVLRCHHDSATTDREAMVLAELQRRGHRIQPELIGRDRCGDMHAQLLRFCPGRQGDVRLWRSSEALASLMGEVARVHRGLAEWARSTFPARPLAMADLGRVFPAVGYAGDLDRLARTIDAARDRVAAAQAPLLPQHGDFWSVNVLWNEGDIRILDWEHFAYAFEPFLDVWTFVLSLCEESGDRDGASLFGTGANAATAEFAVRHYAERVGLPAWLARDAFPLGLARYVHLNASRGRIDHAQRVCRVLSAYVAAPSRFMVSLAHGDPDVIAAAANI